MSLQILVSYLLCSPKLAVFQALRNMYDVFPGNVCKFRKTTTYTKQK